MPRVMPRAPSLPRVIGAGVPEAVSDVDADADAFTFTHLLFLLLG